MAKLVMRSSLVFLGTLMVFFHGTIRIYSLNPLKRSKEFRALSKRSKAVAWVVSNCGSESDRENYVRELRRHIQVTISMTTGYIGDGQNGTGGMSNPSKCKFN